MTGALLARRAYPVGVGPPVYSPWAGPCAGEDDIRGAPPPVSRRPAIGRGVKRTPLKQPARRPVAAFLSTSGRAALATVRLAKRVPAVDLRHVGMDAGTGASACAEWQPKRGLRPAPPTIRRPSLRRDAVESDGMAFRRRRPASRRLTEPDRSGRRAPGGINAMVGHGSGALAVASVSDASPPNICRSKRIGRDRDCAARNDRRPAGDRLTMSRGSSVAPALRLALGPTTAQFCQTAD